MGDRRMSEEGWEELDQPEGDTDWLEALFAESSDERDEEEDMLRMALEEMAAPNSERKDSMLLYHADRNPDNERLQRDRRSRGRAEKWEDDRSPWPDERR